MLPNLRGLRVQLLLWIILPLILVVVGVSAVGIYSHQVAMRDLRGLPGVEEDVDHVTMSPLGTYFIVSFDHYCEQGQLGDDAHPCGLMVYDRSLAHGRSLLRIIGHYDTALDEQGREVIVYQDIDTDAISLLDRPICDADGAADSIRQPVVKPNRDVRPFHATPSRWLFT